jgi:hypothetical protein
MQTKLYKHIVILVSAWLLISAGASAARMEFLNEVVLIPYVEYSSADVTTAVGITVAEPGTIFWTFFDSNGVRRASGSETVIDLQRLAFVWANEAPAGALLANQPGFLIFALDTDGSGTITDADGDFLKASAFFVDRVNSDVAYIPVVDVDDSQLGSINPNNWTQSPLIALPSIDTGITAEFSYLIEGNPGDGDDTEIFIFTTADPGSTQSMLIHDGDGNSVQASISTPNNHLNILAPELINNLPAQYFGDGFFTWTIPSGPGNITNSAFIFSIARSNFFGAAQTLLGSF